MNRRDRSAFDTSRGSLSESDEWRIDAFSSQYSTQVPVQFMQSRYSLNADTYRLLLWLQASVNTYTDQLETMQVYIKCTTLVHYGKVKIAIILSCDWRPVPIHSANVVAGAS